MRVPIIMKQLHCAVLVALIACNVAAFADSRIPCRQSLNMPLHSRATLLIDSSPAGLQIVGTDQDTLRVSCTAATEENASEVAMRFTPNAQGGRLSITHSTKANNNVEVKIELPRKSNVRVRMFAGQVTVTQLKGDKDIEIGAGQISIYSIHDGDYRAVNASVSIGEVHAPAYGAEKGGFFRSLSRRNATGDYRLRAHVTTGQIELLGDANPGENTQGAKSD